MTMWCDFSIGEQVVCVDDDFSNIIGHNNDIPNLPKKGSTYTVRGMRPVFIKKRMTIGLLLQEIRNPEGEYLTPQGWVFYEPSFEYIRFRRAVRARTETGMEILNAIKDNVPKELTVKPKVPEKVD